MSSTPHTSAEGSSGGKGLGAASSDWPGKKGIREGLPQHGAAGGVGSSGGAYRITTHPDDRSLIETAAGNKGETFNVDTWVPFEREKLLSPTGIKTHFQ